jgi:hypothetical protein
MLLTYIRRLSELWLLKLVFFLPHIISSSNTPKLKTSDFIEYKPCIAYSGDMYPLDSKI